MRLSSLARLALLSWLGATSSHANAVPSMPLELQFASADLVVVAKLGERTTCMVERRSKPCVEILADVVLNGPRALPGVRRYLILSSDIAERARNAGGKRHEQQGQEAHHAPEPRLASGREQRPEPSRQASAKRAMPNRPAQGF